jgi:hypothetical protein
MSSKSFQFSALLAFLAMLIGLYKIGNLKYQTVERAAYHWKTKFERNSYGHKDRDSFLDQHHIRKLYVKMLDVDFNLAYGIFPASETQIEYYRGDMPDSNTYIPVVYITNAAIKNMADDQIPHFAQLFLRKALRLQSYTQKEIKEIQVDCDWTESTRDTYFKLLLAMKKLLPHHVFSATIRLYPYKYHEKLGVPPVDKGMLMLYNITNAAQTHSHNAIFDYHEASKYISKWHQYPLPLDYAVPAFSWTILYRYQQFNRIFTGDLVRTELLGSNKLQALDDHTYKVKESFDSYFNHQSFYFRAGDILKVETAGALEMQQAVSLAKRAGMNEQSTLAIFDLDMNELSKISSHDIEKIFVLTP